MLAGTCLDLGPQMDRRTPKNGLGKPTRTLLPDRLPEGRTPVSLAGAGGSASAEPAERIRRLIEALTAGRPCSDARDDGKRKPFGGETRARLSDAKRMIHGPRRTSPRAGRHRSAL